MKIPDDIFIYVHSNTYDRIYSKWLEESDRISLESGIYIRLIVRLNNDDHLMAIYFRMGGHDFEGTDSLKKAIANKAFL